MSFAPIFANSSFPAVMTIVRTAANSLPCDEPMYLAVLRGALRLHLFILSHHKRKLLIVRTSLPPPQFICSRFPVI